MKWKLHYCCSPSAMQEQAELQDIIPTELSGPCWVLFWGTLLCESRSQNNSQRSVYVQNKGRNVKDESNHFSFLCLHFTVKTDFTVPTARVTAFTALLPGLAPSCPSSIDLSSSKRKELGATRHFKSFGKPKVSKGFVPKSEWKVKIAAPFLIRKPKSPQVFQP